MFGGIPRVEIEQELLLVGESVAVRIGRAAGPPAGDGAGVEMFLLPCGVGGGLGHRIVRELKLMGDRADPRAVDHALKGLDLGGGGMVAAGEVVGSRQ